MDLTNWAMKALVTLTAQKFGSVQMWVEEETARVPARCTDLVLAGPLHQIENPERRRGSHYFHVIPFSVVRHCSMASSAAD